MTRHTKRCIYNWTNFRNGGFLLANGNTLHATCKHNNTSNDNHSIALYLHCIHAQITDINLPSPNKREATRGRNQLKVQINTVLTPPSAFVKWIFYDHVHKTRDKTYPFLYVIKINRQAIATCNANFGS